MAAIQTGGRGRNADEYSLPEAHAPSQARPGQIWPACCERPQKWVAGPRGPGVAGWGHDCVIVAVFRRTVATYSNRMGGRDTERQGEAREFWLSNEAALC